MYLLVNSPAFLDDRIDRMNLATEDTESTEFRSATEHQCSSKTVRQRSSSEVQTIELVHY
jgi:hypothetical protein